MGDQLIVRGARENNLRDVNVDLPRNQLIVFTGLSGSGKSSLAFDTIYAEGQRRYVESLSAYARQFLGQMDKPDVDFLEGLSPAISIDQKSASRNPRSTVGTITEVYDYLRLLYARVGIQHDPATDEVVQRQTPQEIVDRILTLEADSRFQVLAPVVRGRKGDYHTLLADLASQGYVRARVDGEIVDLAEADVLPEDRLDRYVNHDIEVIVDRLVLRDGIEQRLTESVEAALILADGHVWVELMPEDQDPEMLTYSQHLFSPTTGRSFEELAPRNFSFNSPYGACGTCDGLGTRFEVDPELIVPNADLSIEDGAIAPFATGASRWYGRLLKATGEEFDIPIDKAWSKLTAKQKKLLLYGSPKNRTFTVRYRNRYGRSRSYTTHWEGVIPTLQRRHADTDSDHSRDRIEGYMREVPCGTCEGARLNEVSLAVRVAGRNIDELCSVSIGEAAKIIDGLSLNEREGIIAAPIVKEIDARLNFLLDVGLDYLTLNRSAATLAGGEAQRIRLASQIGSGLEGVLYVLDEPSIGLHQRDNRRLIETLQHLRDLGNTVLVVEHDQETIMEADWVVDIGPGAGEHGGEIIYSGPVGGLKGAKGSITGEYLKGQREIEIPAERRKPLTDSLVLHGARENNLRSIDVEIPLGCFVAITGVSGSGKSTLINEILRKSLMQKIYRSKEVPGLHTSIEGWEALDKVIDIDQSPIGRTPRSNPATYTGAFDNIRKLFAATNESKVRGYLPGRFSFNVKGGRCEACSGDGTIKIEMHFLPDVYVPCEICKGARYNRETLEVRFKGMTITDVLNMPCEEALEFFSAQPPIARHMQTLVDVGLGYIRLGQPATTLSGGEAQRVKLASELAKRPTGHTIYILDEPTTGLHFEDIRRLLAVLSRLVDQGNSVLVIEHNLDVIKTADWIIDMGPEGGDAGGLVVASGAPEVVAEVSGSHTGRFLAPILSN
tara:strand:+ start:2796 stop:5645 length:2850 start_codon:yes stop_codon:yes gene_type:complete